MKSNDLLSTAQAGEELGVSERRVRALISAGALPSQVIGRSHVIRFGDLDLVRDRKGGRPTVEKPPKKKAPRKKKEKPE